ncbi:MAG: SRPBCC domain-containing protein [Candidatus Kerfeldbacteria bacterium]|nr:SRPBCC domain-containing protein [Candidatus Kerfeldbacteria bacterium]
MKTIQQEYLIAAPIDDVWRALVDVEAIEGWGGGPAEMDDQVGTEFSLWDGDIYGKNIEVIPQEKLVQEWYAYDWEEPSTATFTLFEEDNGTRLEFLHENVPERHAKDIEQGWRDYYLGSLKDYLENK